MRISTAIQQQDTRLFDWPSTANILTLQTKTYSYQYYVGISKHIVNFKKFELDIGIGYSMEMKRFYRPYNLNYFSKNGIAIGSVVYLDQYQNNLIMTPLNIRSFFYKKCYFSMEILPAINMRKKISLQGNMLQDKSLSEFYNVEFNPALGLEIGMFRIALGYRIFQIKRIDKVYQYPTVHNFKETYYKGKNYDTYNPTKFWLAVSYTLKTKE